LGLFDPFRIPEWEKGIRRRIIHSIISGNMYTAGRSPGRLSMDIRSLKNHWDELGKIDPLEAILDRSGKHNRPWDAEEFFATGEREIDDALKSVKELNAGITFQKALDFGCGVGRLTQALAGRFHEVYGVDIAPSMIDLANQYNRHPENCHYVLNAKDDLAGFSDGSVNFIYSVITLQHMHPRFSKKYLKEFLRLLAPGGVSIFQIPSEPIVRDENGSINLTGLILRIFPKGLLDATYRRIRYGKNPRAEMYTIREKDVVGFLRQIKARILSVKQKRGPVYLDCWYFVVKE
jgi:SAM-dependent methyltransferase